jgi:TetR/AcrR family transcriptional repressor of nem operon
MKVSKQKAAEHRDDILVGASKLFREKGPRGVGIAQLMKAAGLTHGGFYGQFASKDALFGETVELMLRDAAAEASKAFARPDSLGRLAKTYMSSARLKGTGDCPIVTLAADMPRSSATVQEAFARGLRAYLSAGRDDRISSDEWLASTAGIAMIVGGMLMARAVVAKDPELATAIVNAVGDHIEDVN